MKLMNFTLLIVLVGLLGTTKALRVLGIYPLAAKSHFSCNEAIMQSLHAAGHQVTMISPFPSETKIDNFKYVDSRFNTFIYVGQSMMNELKDLPLGQVMDLMFDIDTQYCYDVMRLKEIQEALNSTEKLYDIMFVEILLAYECYLPIAQKLGIPVIGTVTLRSWRPADRTVGMPNNPAVIPIEMTPSKPKMSLVERIENLWSYIFLEYHYQMKTRKAVEKFHQEYFDEDLLYKKNISLVFINNHVSLLPRSTIPNVIEIGGIHLKPAKPLPQDLKAFIDEAPQGVILFSFGSIVKASTLPQKITQTFVAAFASIPQRVVWKYEEEIENLPKNIMLSSWLPQRDILAHKNVIAFISHCGLSGVYEAIESGTPVVTIPLFVDQQSNAALLHDRGVAVNIDLKTITKEDILAALNTIINDTSYCQRMQELSRVFKDRPLTPQQSIVYWTEYVIRHNGAFFLKALGTDMSLFQYFMLDIILLVVIAMSVAISLTYLAARKIHTAIVWKRKFEIPSKKEK